MKKKTASRIVFISVLVSIAVFLFILNYKAPNSPVTKDTPSHEQKMWCLAACAVLTQRNQDRHDILGGVERTDKNINSWMQSLSDGWDITDRKSLFASLQWIKQGGHRQYFNEIASYLGETKQHQLKELQRQATRDAELANKIDIVQQHYSDLGEKSLVGWDYSRYISLCSCGSLVGYLTEEEAWDLMLAAARILQDTFDSWEDLGRNYLIGRQFWSLCETQQGGYRYQQAYDWLSSDPESPWLNIPWELDLSGQKVPANEYPNP